MSDTSTAAARYPAPDVPRYQPLVIVLVAVCAGIVIDRFQPLPVLAWWVTSGCAWIAWLGLWRRGWELLAAAALLVAAAAGAAAWHHCQWYLFGSDDLGHYATSRPQPVCVEAIVIKGARRLPAPEFDPMRIIPAGDRTRVQVRITGLRDEATWRAASGGATLLVEGHLLGVHVGDCLRIFAQLAAPRGAFNPGEFDYAKHARADRRSSLLRTAYPDCVSVVTPASGWFLPRLLENMRTDGNKLLWRYLDHQQSGLAAAVLLGVREELGSERSEAFRETGTVHLLAISGLHVGIMAGVLFLLMRLMLVPQGRAATVVAVLTVLYTLLADARPPAVRATVLVGVMCLASCLGRRPLAFNSLAAAALVVLALNPADLFRTGPHLSFLAVAGLAWFAPRWIGLRDHQDRLDRIASASRAWPWLVFGFLGRWVWHLTLVSATIWLLALPLVMSRFHLLTPIAVALNTLLWLPMVVALSTGFGVLVCGWLSPPLGVVFGRCCDGSLWLLESAIAAARAVPGGHFWVPGPPDWWLLGFYGALGLMAAVPRLRPPRRWCAALLAGWTGIGFAGATLPGDPARLDCTFLSMGHGCAVVLELPSGQTMLYDAGHFGPPGGATRSIAACLWSRGITHLDAVVVSHADADHYNALPELLKRFSVGVIYVSPVMFEDDSPAMVALAQAIHEAGVPIREIHAGNQLQGGDDCRIEVLNPPQRGVLGSDNANSLTLDVLYRDRRILLPGDLESPGLDDVLAEEPLDCAVLLAPHHGSHRSDPTGLADWCTPEWVVISGSHRYDPSETEAAYRAAGARVLHTAKVGAVRVTIDQTGAGVEIPCAGRPR